MRKRPQHLTASNEAIELVAFHFRALGEASRLKLIIAVGNGKKNVSQLVADTGLTQPNASIHLQALADAGILARHKEGQSVYYTVADLSVLELYEQTRRRLQKQLADQMKAFGK